MLSFWTQLGERPVLAARARVMLVLALMGAGLLLARGGLGVPSGAAFGVGALLGGAGAIAPWRWARALLALAVLAGAIGWGQLRWHERAGDDLVRLTSGDTRAIVTVEALVTSPPEREVRGGDELARFARREEAWRFTARVDRALYGGAWVGASGGVWVRVDGAEPIPMGAGSRVRMTGVFTPIAPPSNPGEDDARLYGAQEGMSGHLSLSGAALVEDAAPAAGFGAVRAAWVGVRESARARAAEVLRRAAGADPSGERAALLRGLLLGEYDASRRELRDSFARTGLAHALSISGFHIVVLTAFLSALVRLAGERGVVQHAVVVVVLLAYLGLVAPSAPVVRSVLMVLALTIAEWSGRRYDRVTLLGWVCALLLLWRPLDLWSLGFQLSAGLTALLLWAGPVFHERLFAPALRGLAARPVTLMDVALRGVKSAFSTSVLCVLASTPLVMMRIGVVTPLAVVATMVVSPLIVVLLFAAYGALLLGLCFPALAGVCAGVLGALADVTIGAVRFFEGLPLSSTPAPPVGLAWTVCATGVVLWILIARAGRAVAVGAMAVVVGWCALTGLTSQRLRAGVLVRIDCLDVGNGTCMLVRSGDRALLWDCGTLARADGSAQVTRACRALGVWRVPVAVVTHPDIDHFGLLPRVARDLGVRRVATCARFLEQARGRPEGGAAECARLLAARGVELVAAGRDDEITVGVARLKVLSPRADAAFPLDNDHSLVALVTHPSLARPAALLCGDASDGAIASMSERGLAPLVMEAPHHGSARAAAIGWVRGNDPAVVMQSSGPSRSDDPRWAGVRAGRTWLSTCSLGACWAEIMADGSVRCGGVGSR